METENKTMNSVRLLMLSVCLICAIAAPAFVPQPSPTPLPPSRHAGLEGTADEATADIKAEARAALTAASRARLTARQDAAGNRTALAGAPGRS